MKRQRVKFPWDLKWKKHGKAQEVYSSGLSTAPSVRRSNLIVLQISLQLLRHIQISFHPKVSL